MNKVVVEEDHQEPVEQNVGSDVRSHGPDEVDVEPGFEQAPRIRSIQLGRAEKISPL